MTATFALAVLLHTLAMGHVGDEVEESKAHAHWHLLHTTLNAWTEKFADFGVVIAVSAKFGQSANITTALAFLISTHFLLDFHWETFLFALCTVHIASAAFEFEAAIATFGWR